DGTTDAAYFAFSSPVVANGVVYANSESDRSIYALDATTGAVHWRFTSPPSDDEVPEAPAGGHGVVYVVFRHAEGCGLRHGSIDALDATTGAVRRHLHDSTQAYSAPAVVDGVIYVGSTAHHVSALDVATGAVRWRFQTDGAAESLPPG